MHVPLRAPIALLATLLVSAGLDFEAILHVHRDWAQELRAHELSLVETPGPCEKGPHWDRARSERHSACVACTVSATALGAPLGAARVARALPRTTRPATPDSPHFVASCFAAPGGRSPPPPHLRLG